jgi:hypothetical protein
MENSVQILMQLAGVVSGCVNVCFASVTAPFSIPVAGGTVSLAFAGRVFREQKRELFRLLRGSSL